MDLTVEQEPLETIESRTFVASPEDLLSGEAHSLINCHGDECAEGDIRTSRQDSKETCESTSTLLQSLSSEIVAKGENEAQSVSLNEDLNCNSQVLNERTEESPASSGLLYIQDCNLPEESQQSQMLIISNQRESTSKNASRMFECEYVGCGRTFTTAAHLRYHMRTHTGEKPFCCTHEGCGRNFTSSGYLRYHQCTHSGKRTFKCQHPRCERVFAWPAHLKYHMKTHTGDRAYRCTFEGCNKSFYVLQRLNVHMRVHTGERPYTCAVDGCNKSFTTQGNLKNHMRIHTGERPYSCPVEGCGRTFTEHSSLRKHKLTHTGEKPYVCEVCGKMFSQSGSRNAHQKRHADSTKQDRRPKKSNKYVTSVIVQGDDEIQQRRMLENLDGAGGDQEQSITSQALVFSQAEHAIVTQAGGDQLVLAQPIVAKEVSIETTPVQPMSLLVQTTDDPMAGNDSLVQATADVVSLAETVVAQQTVIHTMLDGATIIPTASQSGLAMVDHVLQPSDVEHMMQNVVSQHILSGHIQLPLTAGELEPQSTGIQERDRDPPPLTVDMTGFMQQTQHQPPRREDEEDHGLNQGECVGVCAEGQHSTKLEIRQDLEYQED